MADLVRTFAAEFNALALSEIAAAAELRAKLLRQVNGRPVSLEWGFADDLDQLARYCRRVLYRQRIDERRADAPRPVPVRSD